MADPTQKSSLTLAEFDAALKGVGIESAEHPGCYYRLVDGVQEWFNPPLMLDDEYRTTERCEGKPVYAKRISYKPTETIASGVFVEIPHGVPDFGYLERYSGRANRFPLPTIGRTGSVFGVSHATDSKIVLSNYNTTWSTEYTLYLDIYYTKTES